MIRYGYSLLRSFVCDRSVPAGLERSAGEVKLSFAGLDQSIQRLSGFWLRPVFFDLAFLAGQRRIFQSARFAAKSGQV